MGLQSFQQSADAQIAIKGHSKTVIYYLKIKHISLIFVKVSWIQNAEKFFNSNIEEKKYYHFLHFGLLKFSPIYPKKEEEEIKKCDMWHVTREMWHGARDMWHVTCGIWHVTCCGGWTFSQSFSSLALTVCDFWYYEDWEEKAHGPNQSINNKTVCRTAPATPGLLIISIGFHLT